MCRNLSRAFLAPDTESTIDISGDDYLRIISERDAERQNRSRVEAELAQTRAELAQARADLDQSRTDLAQSRVDVANVTAKHDVTQVKLDEATKKLESLPSNMWEFAKNMNPGEALIATVAAPVMTAPLAAATVVKGFQSVGTGIASLFQGKK